MFPLLCAALLIFLDQATKFAANQWLAPVGVVRVIPDWFCFYYIENEGASFSILEGFRWGFVAITVVAVVGLLWVMYNNKHPARGATMGALVMILAGAAGNFIDRLLSGRVVDFLRFTFIEFPVFNVADILINVGMVWILLLMVFGKAHILGFDKK